MTRLRKPEGPWWRSFGATYQGLGTGYLVFLGVLVLAVFSAGLGITPKDGELEFLFFSWMFLAIPLGMGGWLLAWLFVMPVDRFLASCSENRTVYLTVGMSAAACVAFAILNGINDALGPLFAMRSLVWWAAPGIASITSGAVIGDQLWKGWQRNLALIAAAPDGA